MKIQIMRTEKKVREFSQNYVGVLCFLWIAGALYGMVIVWRDNTQLSYLLDYIGQPMTVGVVGYLAKAAFENREKIKKSKQSAEPIQKDPGR